MVSYFTGSTILAASTLTKSSIIQNSVEDWEEEAGRMSQVYQHALCNIAATGAINSAGGLFFDRNPEFARPFIVSPAALDGKSLCVLGNCTLPLSYGNCSGCLHLMSPRKGLLGEQYRSVPPDSKSVGCTGTRSGSPRHPLCKRSNLLGMQAACRL